MNTKTPTRRAVIGQALTATAVVPAAWILGSQVGFSEETAKAAELKLIAETDPVASALKYKHDASKAKERNKERMGIAADKQNCANCMLYTKKGEIDGKEVGKCTMLAAGMVTATGWCNSWSKKA